MVEGDGGDRIHFLDWGGPPATPHGAGIVAIHGLGQTGWIWAPRSRRLAGSSGPRRFVTLDLRGHGLSDAPTEDGRYDLDVLAGDAVAVAEGAGLLSDSDADRIVLAGHGFGAIVAGAGGRRPRGQMRRSGPRGRRLGDARGHDRRRRRRVPARPRRTARGDALAAFLGPEGVRSGDLGRRSGTCGAGDDRGDPRRAGRPVGATACHRGHVRTMFAYDPRPTSPPVSALIAALIAGGDESDRACVSSPRHRRRASHPGATRSRPRRSRTTVTT